MTRDPSNRLIEIRPFSRFAPNSPRVKIAYDFVEDDMDEDTTKRNVARNALGIGLIAVGAITLLHQLGVIGAIRWDIVWPVSIVVLGIIILKPNIAALHRRLLASRAGSGNDVSGENSAIESKS